jgi:type I restriction enzyme S subunit
MEFVDFKIKEIAKVTAGGDKPKIVSNSYSDETPIPIYSNGMENDGLYGYTNIPKVDADTVTISARGVNVGKVCYRETAFLPIVRLLSLIPNRSVINAKYMYYNLKMMNISGTGSAQPQITVPMISELKMHIHKDLIEQEKIASFLSVLDEKIKNNNRINRNLSEQAKILYKEWFIDFGPFEGEMPGAWHLGTVEEIIELHDSKRKPLSGRQRDDMEKIYPYYGATSIMDYVDNYIFDGIYLLLGEDGSVIDTEGYPILQYVFGKFWPNNHAHVITGKNGFSVEMLYLLFSLTNVQNIVTGAVQLKISQQNLKTVEVVVPSYEAITEFDEMIQPIFREIRRLRTENEKLTTLRDNLLPKLMSGELDVSNLDI